MVLESDFRLQTQSTGLRYSLPLAFAFRQTFQPLHVGSECHKEQRKLKGKLISQGDDIRGKNMVNIRLVALGTNLSLQWPYKNCTITSAHFIHISGALERQVVNQKSLYIVSEEHWAPL